MLCLKFRATQYTRSGAGAVPETNLCVKKNTLTKSVSGDPRTVGEGAGGDHIGTKGEPEETQQTQRGTEGAEERRAEVEKNRKCTTVQDHMCSISRIEGSRVGSRVFFPELLISS